MRFINVLLAILVSLLIAFGVFEGGLRLLGYGHKTPLVEFDSKLGWSKKPNFELSRKSGEYDVTIQTNELGLNDDPLTPKGDRARVLALGDSFTQGYSVNRDDLFVDLLEDWWQAEGRNVDVVNAGTEAYDTAQAVAWYLEHGEALEPDVVLLFAYENDLYWNSQSAYSTPDGPREKPRFGVTGERERESFSEPSQRGFLASLAIGKLLGLGKPAFDENHLFTPSGASRPASKEHGVLLDEEPEYMTQVRDHTRGALKALAEACAARGTRAVVIPIPGRARYDEGFRDEITQQLAGATNWSADNPVELFLDLAQSVDIATVDPRETLEQKSEDGPLYFGTDWHFNPEGNRVFAGILHDELDRLGFAPPVGGTLLAAMPAPVESEDASEGIPFWAKLFGTLWVSLSALYIATYRDESAFLAPVKVGLLLGSVFGIFFGVQWLQGVLPGPVATWLVPALVFGLLAFVVYKLGRRVSTILELLKAFTLRGHWYLMPLVVVLLTVGSLLVVAASSPLIAPFIYTLF